MASTENGSLNDVLSELENILELWTELEMNTQLQPLFGRNWLEEKLHGKVQEFEGSSVDVSVAGGFKNLARLVKLHRELTAKGLLYINDQLTMVINCQKAYLGGDTVPKEAVYVNEPILEPLMAGAMPPHASRAFSIKAIATTSSKLAALHGLYLEWDENHQALECFKGRTNETHGSPDLCIVPANISKLCCSVGYGKILIKSSRGITANVPLFVHLSDNDDADDFVDYLLKKAPSQADCQYFESDELDKIVAEYE
ncbi:MAG: hypothetical protein Q9208_004151 [Pyrenodesmia sp. 3 TL-2023]